MFSFAPSISATPQSSGFHHWHSRNPVQRVKALPSVNVMPNRFTLTPELDLEMNAAGLAHSDPVLPLAFSTSVLIHALHCCRQGQTGVGTKMCPVLASFLSSGFVLNVTLALAHTREGQTRRRGIFRRHDQSLAHTQAHVCVGSSSEGKVNVFDEYSIFSLLETHHFTLQCKLAATETGRRPWGHACHLEHWRDLPLHLTGSLSFHLRLVLLS